MKCINVAIIGAYPPPYGGNSVHVARLAELLHNREYVVHVFDYYGKRGKSEQHQGIRIYRFSNIKIFRYILLTVKLYLSKYTICHIHVSHFNKLFLLFPLIFLISFRSSKNILTIHSGDFAKFINNSNGLRKTTILYILSKMHHIICVGIEQKISLERMDISPKKLHVIPAYLPPVMKISEFIEEKIRDLRNKTSTIVLISGYAMELYGFHIACEAISDLRKEGRNIGLIISLYSGYDKEYLDKIYEMTNNDTMTLFFSDLNPEHFSYLISSIDIYIRPTDRDGDAVTIREAAYFNKQVIASDCVDRPGGCLLFKTNDVTDLKEAIKKALADKELGLVQQKLSESSIIEVYQAVENKENSEKY